MDKLKIIYVGFLLFSFFFGAGNLIFPPVLGYEAGSSLIPALIGFCLTGVVLPLLTVVATSQTKGGLLNIAGRNGKTFGLIFTSIVFLTVGPFYCIPRAAAVSYELGFRQILPLEGDFVLLLFSIGFFALIFYLTVRPGRLIDIVGRLLTPALLICIAALCLTALFKYPTPTRQATAGYESAALSSGFLQGYFTMDVLGAMAFGLVIAGAFSFKDSSSKNIRKSMIFSELIAGVGLASVYLGLSFIGRIIPEIPGGYSNTDGAKMLGDASAFLFPHIGHYLFGIIVFLAGLTTCIGLISACASFFNNILPKIKFSLFLVFFCILSLIITNFGLNNILSIALPMLQLIYPPAIVLALLAIGQYLWGISSLGYKLSIWTTLFFSLIDLLKTLEMLPNFIDHIIGYVPLHEEKLAWVIPGLCMAIIGYWLDYNKKRIYFPEKLGV